MASSSSSSGSTIDWAVSRDVAVPRLLELHGDRLFGLARRICGQVEEAQDLVQETFVQAWRKWEQFAGRSDPVVWLYTIARHACQRMHRKRSGEPQQLESLDAPNLFGQPRLAIAPSGADEFDEHARRELQEALGVAITALPEDFRMAIVLKDIVGFSVAEVASILDIKTATVKTRVHRARMRLRDAIAAGLPQQELPPPAYSRQVCMDLLKAKQESLDRGVEMPNADAIICDRCRAVFSTLDLTKDVCGRIADDGMPEQLRSMLLRELQAADG